MKTLRLLKRFLIHLVGQPCSCCGLPMVWVRVMAQDGHTTVEHAYWCVKCRRFRVDADRRRTWVQALRLPLPRQSKTMSWHFPSYVTDECRTCHAKYTRKPNEAPPVECDWCGNRGQSLLGCRRCSRHIPAARFAAIAKAEGWDYWEGDDYCPVCCGYEVPEDEVFTRHEYEGEPDGRCVVCSEAARHCIHNTWLDEEEDG